MRSFICGFEQEREKRMCGINKVKKEGREKTSRVVKLLCE